MPSPRDPLSVRYDPYVHDLIMRAARESRQGRGVQAWIASPRAEFRARDQGGRTAHERAFTRAAYYLIFKNAGRYTSGKKGTEGEPSGWSLKLTWGHDKDRRASSGGRLARPVLVRLYPSGQARRSGPAWVGTSRQSTAADRG
jgi:hypothetical protein